jgi:hypothetical protein
MPKKPMKPGESVATQADRSKGGRAGKGRRQGPTKSNVLRLMEATVADPDPRKDDPGDLKLLKEWYASDKSGFTDRMTRMLLQHDEKVEKWREFMREKKREEYHRRTAPTGLDPSAERVSAAIDKLLKELKHG